MISKEQLMAVMPNVTADNLEKYCQPLNNAMGKFDISTPKRIAAFIAQIAHESNQLVATVENLNYSVKGLLSTFPKYFRTAATAGEYAMKPEKIANYVYGNRLGNNEPGDGWKFRGRGLIQITGKLNYEVCGKGIGADLPTHPDLLEGPIYASESAAWFWNFRSLNSYADLDNFEAITRRINGGLNGEESRIEFWERAKSNV